MTNKYVTFALAMLYVILWVLLFVTVSHGAVRPKNRANSLGVNEVYTNPNTYLLASIIEGQILKGKSDKDFYTNVRFQPYATMGLYDQTVLFCGEQSTWFNGKRGAVVVTYETRSHKTFKGIACHELTSVFEVPGER